MEGYMNSELSALVDTCKQLTLLAQALEQRSAAAIQENQKSGHTLQHTLATLRNDVNQLIEGSGHQVAQQVKHGMDLALTQGTAKYEQVVNSSTAKMDNAGRNVEQVLHETSSFVHRQIWLTYGAIAGAIVLLFGGGALLLWFESQSYNEAHARTATAQIDAETMEAFNQVGVTSCGGHPCIKLDGKSPRWGSKGEYVLIDAAPKKKSN
jgi:ElaB/YqjD/DUF883 family membrane-anchored ribosome-binding protein